jgi:hypothetical protein
MEQVERDYAELMAANYPEEFAMQLDLRGRYVILSEQYLKTLRKLSRALVPVSDHMESIQSRRAAIHDRARVFIRFVDVAELEDLVYELRDELGGTE